METFAEIKLFVAGTNATLCCNIANNLDTFNITVSYFLHAEV